MTKLSTAVVKKINRILLFAFVTLTASCGWAQSDGPYIRGSIVASDEKAVAVGLGSPPLQLTEKTSWANGVFWRQVRVLDLEMNDFSITPIFIHKLPNWKMVAGLGLGFRATTHHLALNADRVSTTTFFNFMKDNQEMNEARWSFGVIFPNKTFPIPIIPNFSYEYQQKDSSWIFSFRYPEVSAKKIVDDLTRIGVFTRYDNTGYFISEEYRQRLVGKYFVNEKVFLGIIAHRKWSASLGLRMNLELGTLVLRRLKTMDQNYEKVSEIVNQSGDPFANLSLSWSFQ